MRPTWEIWPSTPPSGAPVLASSCWMICSKPPGRRVSGGSTWRFGSRTKLPVSSTTKTSSLMSPCERTTTGTRWRMLSSCFGAFRRVRGHDLAQEGKRGAQSPAAATGAPRRTLDEMRGLRRDPVPQGARAEPLDLQQVLLPLPHLRAVLHQDPGGRGYVRRALLRGRLDGPPQIPRREAL